MNKIVFNGFVGLVTDKVLIGLNKINDIFTTKFVAYYDFVFDHAKMNSSEYVCITKFRQFH